MMDNNTTHKAKVWGCILDGQEWDHLTRSEVIHIQTQFEGYLHDLMGYIGCEEDI